MKNKNYFLVALFLSFSIGNILNAQINNTFQGVNSGNNNTGSYSNGFGMNSLLNNIGLNNSGFGLNTLSNSKGGFNSAFGNGALFNNDSGELNCAFGTRALENNLTGNRNVAIGHRSMGGNTSPGSYNTAVGYGSLLFNSGDRNTSLGHQSPRDLQKGDGNVFIGEETAINLTNGSYNVFLGKIAVSNNLSNSIVTGNDTNGTIILADGNTSQRLFISNRGNVGIGLGNNIIPANLLDLAGGMVIGSNYVPRNSQSPVAGFIAPRNGLLVEGSVGIGNSSPNNKVEITHGQTGNSGLRFTNLNSTFNPNPNTFSSKFLTVNATGDVVLNNLPAVSTTNQLDSNQNNLTSTVNGVASQAPIINTISNTFSSTNQFVTTVNGVASDPITIPIPAYVDTDQQTLALNGNTLSISNGNSVDLPILPTTNQLDSSQNTLTSTVNGVASQAPIVNTISNTFSNNNQLVTIVNGVASDPITIPIPAYVDTDQQTLSISGNSLTIYNGNTVALPTYTDTDQQTLSLVGNTLSIANGNSVTLPSTTTSVIAGTNTSVTGNGSQTTPYQISATDTSLYNNNGSINQSTTTNNNRIVNMNNRNIWFNTSTSQNNGKIYIGSNTSYPNSTGNYKLFVEGGILTEKVKVALRNSNNWADYVFDKNYKLMPLEEVEKFVKQNNHLPRINSAEELSNDGLDIAEMQAKHMEKIEELTLYAIEQNKKIKSQEKAIEDNKKEIEELKLQVQALIQKNK
jgi:hypothetical protein